MSSPPVRLDDFGLTHLEIHCEPVRATPGEMTHAIGLDYQVGFRKDNPSASRLGMEFRDSVKDKNGAELLRIKAAITGFFTFPEDTPLPKRERIIRVNGLTILYGVLRGLLMPAVAAFPMPFRYILPTIDMIQVIKKAEEKKQAAASVAREKADAYRRMKPTARKRLIKKA